MFSACVRELSKIVLYGEDYIKQLEYATPIDAPIINLIHEAKDENDLNNVFHTMAKTVTCDINDINEDDTNEEITTKCVESISRAVNNLQIKKPPHTNKYIYAAFNIECRFKRCCVEIDINITSDIECQIIAVETDNVKWNNRNNSPRMTITPNFFENMTNQDELYIYVKMPHIPINPIYIELKTTTIKMSDTLTAHLALNMVRFMRLYNATKHKMNSKITDAMLPTRISNILRHKNKMQTDVFFTPFNNVDLIGIHRINDEESNNTPEAFYIAQMFDKK